MHVLVLFLFSLKAVPDALPFAVLSAFLPQRKRAAVVVTVGHVITQNATEQCHGELTKEL